MRIKKIKIEGFKSIYEPLEIDFNDVKGLWKIEGSVGAGKTTIGEAIIWGLFGDVRGKTIGDLISWGRKFCRIETDIESRGHNIHILRKSHIYGNMSAFDVTVDGEPLVFTNKRDAQSQLEKEYYDVSKMTMDLLCVISFNNFKSLATLNVRDTKEFLDQVFGFYVLSNYMDICKDLRKDTQAEITSQSQAISNIEAQINKIRQMNSREIIEGSVDETARALSEALDRKRDKTASFKAELDTINKDMIRAASQLSETKVLGTNKAKEIKLIETGKCPTCGAAIDQAELPVKIKEKEALLALWNQYNAQYKELQAKRSSTEAARDTEIKVLDQTISELRIKKSRLEDQAKHSNISMTEISALEEEKSSHSSTLSTLRTDEEGWTRLIDIFNVNIRQKILESFIPRINHYICEYTQMLQLPYIVEFDNSFNCSIKMFTINQEVSISSLSTGQLKSVDVCIILGVLKAIMSGCSFNCLFLDELFSNLDADLRYIMCKVLKENIQEGQTIFIISHSELDDKWFDGSIKASLGFKDGGIRNSCYEIIHRS